MRIAIIELFIKGHNLRGTGIYANNLKKALGKTYPGEIIEANASKLPTNCDIYHFPYFDPFFLTLPFIIHKPIVITIHDLIPLRFPEYFPRGFKGEFKWQIQKMLARGAEAIITDSYASKADIGKYMGIKESKIHPIYLAADNIFFHKLLETDKLKVRSKYSLPEQFALYVGDVNWNKNLVNVIKAVKSINFPLVIVSKVINNKQSDIENLWLQELVQIRKEIQDSKLFFVLNNVSQVELANLYQMSKMLLYPSRYEGFGLPVMEAFASGCPVITTDKGSLKEITGDAVIVVNPESPNEIAHAIQNILNNQELCLALITKGNSQAKQFSWEKTAEKTYSVYTQVLAKH